MMCVPTKAFSSLNEKLSVSVLLQQMTKGMMDKTLHWEFVESVEQPKIVTAAGGAVVSKDNAFGQLTVRFHTLQVPYTISICSML